MNHSLATFWGSQWSLVSVRFNFDGPLIAITIMQSSPFPQTFIGAIVVAVLAGIIVLLVQKGLFDAKLESQRSEKQKTLSQPSSTISKDWSSPKTPQLVNLSGNWQGYALHGANKYHYEWNISQEGQNISGNISISTLEGIGRSTYAFEGTLQDSTLLFRGTRWLSSQLGTWCIAAGELKIVEFATPLELKGTWGPNPVPGGCPLGSNGQIQIMRR
jgi:hypothetical protein